MWKSLVTSESARRSRVESGFFGLRKKNKLRTTTVKHLLSSPPQKRRGSEVRTPQHFHQICFQKSPGQKQFSQTKVLNKYSSICRFSLIKNNLKVNSYNKGPSPALNIQRTVLQINHTAQKTGLYPN